MTENNPKEEHSVFFSVSGVTRFDAKAVADALRHRHLTPMEAHGLANLLEGKHPHGLKLVMQGQGKGWKPIAEGAAAYRRLMLIGKFVEEKVLSGCTTEDAVFDAAIEFCCSEATIYRDLRLYRAD
ncbi:hypothetical protein [Sphingobium yanoikuyae]